MWRAAGRKRRRKYPESNETDGDNDSDDQSYQDDDLLSSKKKRIILSYNNDLDDEMLTRHSLPKYIEEELESSREALSALKKPNEPWMIGYNEK
ncbi:unnamed protein product [Gongylonema pulchrum]|uniref:DRY_EERY domain-containing protein n=1 Tax=Gongylonema pulchrum TaxID=637853 RepID=A0A183DJ60_9BILA|nr:unnamed protein product [Gongylonema pulchrum]